MGRFFLFYVKGKEEHLEEKIASMGGVGEKYIENSRNNEYFVI